MRLCPRTLFIALTACGPMQPFDDVASTAQPIVGGTVDNGDPAVVALTSNGNFYCTGTLIGPLTVLTAGHCINAVGGTVRVAFGTMAATPTATAAVMQQYRHPQYSAQQLSHDVGLLRLGAAVTNVAPMGLYTSALSQADVGKPIRHVGFGVTSGNQTGGGTKREVTYAVRQLTQFNIESGAAGQQTCNGDSGGPAFMKPEGQTEERIAGVVSYGDDNCNQTGFDARVDIDLQWIQTTAAQWDKLPTCAADGACLKGCNPIDVDCACLGDGQCTAQCPDLSKDPDCPKDCVANGVCSTQACPAPDVDCVELGQSCTADTQCVFRLCSSDPQRTQTYCSRPCSANECPSSMQCLAGKCVLPQKPEVELGQACSDSTFCKGGGICAGPAGGPMLCALKCTGPGTCASPSQSCEASVDGQLYCRERPVLPGGPTTTPGGNGTASKPPGELSEVVGTCSSAAGPPWALAVLALGTALRRRRK